jgi:hypothetical protein
MILKTAPNNNWLIDTRNTEIKQQDEITKKVNRLTRVPRNSPAVVTQKIEQLVNLAPSGLGFIPPLVDFGGTFGSNSGFFVWATEPIGEWLHFIERPPNLKLANTNDVRLTINLSTVGDFTAFSTVADSIYNVDFYTSIRIGQNIEGRNFGGAFGFNASPYNTQLLTQKHVFTHDPAVGPSDYKFTNSTVELALSDVIQSRNYLPNPFITELPSFLTDPTKIQQFQYDKLISENVTFYIDWGFSFDSYSLLTGNNKTHFEEVSGYPSFSVGRFGASLSFILSYFGTSSNYETFNS